MAERREEPAMARRTFAGTTFGKSESSKAMVPVTNGAEILVPDAVASFPSGAREVIACPGAPMPFLPIE